MCYELTDQEWAAIKPMLQDKPRGDNRPILNDNFFWGVELGCTWRGA